MELQNILYDKDIFVYFRNSLKDSRWDKLF